MLFLSYCLGEIFFVYNKKAKMKNLFFLTFIFLAFKINAQDSVFYSQSSNHLLVKTVIKQKLLNSMLSPSKSKKIYEKIIFTEILAKVPEELWSVKDSVFNNMLKNEVYYVQYKDKLSFWVGLLESKTIYFKYKSGEFQKTEEDFLKTKSFLNLFVIKIIVQTMIFVFVFLLTKGFTEIMSKVLLLVCLSISLVFFLWKFSELANYIYLFIYKCS
jgi:hypothetical protein